MRQDKGVRRMTAAAAQSSIGFMKMPADFRYRSVFLRGRPKHRKFDAF